VEKDPREGTSRRVVRDERLASDENGGRAKKKEPKTGVYWEGGFKLPSGREQRRKESGERGQKKTQIVPTFGRRKNIIFVSNGAGQVEKRGGMNQTAGKKIWGFVRLKDRPWRLRKIHTSQRRRGREES